MRHNHVTRELQPEGTDCPLCVDYYVRLVEAADPAVERFGVPNYPPVRPFSQGVG